MLLLKMMLAVRHLDILRARGFQAPHHHAAHPLEELMAKGHVRAAVLREPLRIHEDRGGRLECACAVFANERLIHPGPAERLATVHDINSYRWLTFGCRFNRDLAALQKIKTPRWISGAKQHLLRLKLHEMCAISDEREMMFAQPAEERMGRNELAEIVCHSALSAETLR